MKLTKQELLHDLTVYTRRLIYKELEIESFEDGDIELFLKLKRDYDKLTMKILEIEIELLK